MLDTRTPEQRIALLIAGALTLLGVGMAAASALERSAPGHGRWLVTGTAVALAIGAHMLPALARRMPAAWVLWAGCVLATLYSHAAFYAGAGRAAGDVRATATAPSAQAQQLAAELATLPATPAADAAAALAKAQRREAEAAAQVSKCEREGKTCPQARARLAAHAADAAAASVALTSAQRAGDIRAQLAELASTQDTAANAARATAIDAALASSAGVSTSTVSLITSIVQSLLVECLAALMWWLAMRPETTSATKPGRAGPAAPPGRSTGQAINQLLLQLPAPGYAGPLPQATAHHARRRPDKTKHPPQHRHHSTPRATT